jgi:uncharacterized protein YkwD
MEVISVRTSLRIRIAAACVLSSVATVLATAPAEASRTDCVPEAGWPAQNAAVAAEVVQRVNAYRASLGLSQLGQSQSLTNAAAWKAAQLAVDVPAAGQGAFLHEDWGTGRTVPARLQACGYGDTAGENIAYGQESAEEVMNAWIASEGHRRNLQYPAWGAIGVGVASGPGGIAWVQDFGVSNPDPISSPTTSLAVPSPTTPSIATPLTAPVTAPLVSAQGPPAAAPGLAIMTRPKSRTRKRTVRIRWAISGVAQQVQCALNGRTLKRCGSTGRTLRHMKRGRHTFHVTVIGPSGSDTARVRWRILRR